MIIPFQQEKIENAICFFASEHKKKTRNPLYQTFLYKYLSLFEFEILKETGDPPLGLTYKAMDKGPVPDQIYNNRDNLNSKCFRFEKRNNNEYIISSTGKPDLNYFSDYEINKMNNLIFIYAQKFVSSAMMSDISHERIKSWQIAFKKGENSYIKFEDEFDSNINEKDINDLSSPEEKYVLKNEINNRI